MNNDDILSIPRLVTTLRRELVLVIASVVTFVVLGVIYLLITTPLYSSKTSILLDPAKAQSVSEISSKAISQFEGAAINSRMEVIRSRRVALKAYEIMGGDPSQITERELNRFRSGLQVSREGESYVLTIRYTSEDAALSAQRANAFAQAYVNDQLNSFSEDSEKAEDWLQNKIETLRKQSVAANQAVQDFRQEHNIIQTRGGTSVNDQQLGNINNRLGDAKANTAAARVKYFHSKNIVDKRDITAAVAQAFDNDVINNIRAEYLSDKQRLLKLRRTLGNKHDTVVSLERKLAESRNIIFSEMQRIAQSHKSEYEVAMAQENLLQESLDSLIGVKIGNDEQAFELEALEKEAESFVALYNDYLKKYEVMQQQQSFPVAEASIISKAIPASHKSHPKTIIIFGMCMILGGGLGVLLALIKDNMDGSFKRAGQIKNATGLNFLGFLPAVNRHLGESQNTSFSNAIYAQSVDEPYSLQAETCRNIDVALQRKAGEAAQIVGVSADTPHDGKSIAAGNLALYLAASGHKCLLVDADSRNPDLTHNNIGSIKHGLSDLLAQKVDLEEVIIRDSKTGLSVIPSEILHGVGTPNLVHTKAMRNLMKRLKDKFDYIVVNLPAMAATSDASSSTVYVDQFLFVLEWAKSNPNAFNFMLKTNEMPEDKVVGVVLAQADMKKMARDYGHKVHTQYVKAA